MSPSDGSSLKRSVLDDDASNKKSVGGLHDRNSKAQQSSCFVGCVGAGDNALRGCTRLGIDYQLVRTGDYLDAVLSKFLHQRMDIHARTRRPG